MKSTINQMLAQIHVMSDCIITPATILPKVPLHIILPDDLLESYSLCGGLELFIGSHNTIRILPPEMFQNANLAILGEEIENDISSTWFIFATGHSGEFVSIDLAKNRPGWCYDSYIDRHGVQGVCPIIARSFTEWLRRVIDTRGQAQHFWLLPSFLSYGDAYDKNYMPLCQL